MRFVSTIAGRNYVASSSEAVIYDLRPDGLFAGTGAYLDGSSGKEVVTATGWVATSSRSGHPMMQLVNGQYIDGYEGWTATEQMGIRYSQKSAQTYVDQVIKNNKRILENNLVCARFSYKLTASQRAQLYNLQTRLNTRNESLLQDGLVEAKSVSAPAGYAELQSYLDSVMQNGGVGSVTAAIVIAAVVVASLSTAAYFCYKYYAAESEKDVKFSDELTKVLTSKLTEEEYAQLLEETRGIVTKAKLRSKFSSKAWLIGAAIGIAAGWALIKGNERV